MWFLHSRKPRSTGRTLRGALLFRPRLEALEDRRLLSGGALDPTFGSGGLLTTQVGLSGTPDAAFAVAVYPMAIYPSSSTADAGKLVVAGQIDKPDGTYAIVVERFNGDGSGDTSFGGGTGVVELDNADTTPGKSWNGLASYWALPSLAIQADDRLVLTFSGADAAGAGSNIYLERLQANGTPDTGFGNQGVVATLLGQVDIPWSVALQTNGQILVGGQQNLPSGTHSFLVARYNTAGALDQTFGVNGIASASGLSVTQSSGVAMSLQPDGKIVLAGTQDSTAGTNYAFALARFLAAGPQIGSFSASPDPIPAGSNLTLTASSITDANPGATITQVAFYYYDSSGNKVTLGTLTQSNGGAWTLTSATAFGLVSGTYTLYAQAEDNYGIFGDPFALTLTVN